MLETPHDHNGLEPGIPMYYISIKKANPSELSAKGK